MPMCGTARTSTASGHRIRHPSRDGPVSVKPVGGGGHNEEYHYIMRNAFTNGNINFDALHILHKLVSYSNLTLKVVSAVHFCAIYFFSLNKG